MRLPPPAPLYPAFPVAPLDARHDPARPVEAALALAQLIMMLDEDNVVLWCCGEGKWLREVSPTLCSFPATRSDHCRKEPTAFRATTGAAAKAGGGRLEALFVRRGRSAGGVRRVRAPGPSPQTQFPTTGRPAVAIAAVRLCSVYCPAAPRV